VLASLRTPLALLVAVLVTAASGASAHASLRIATGRFGNVFETDEAKVLWVDVDWPETGAAVTGTLTLEVHDAYGTRVLGEARDLNLTPGRRDALVAEVGPTTNGLLTAVAVLRATTGEELARATTTLGIVPPLPDQDANRSAIGYFFDPDRTELRQADAIAAQVAALGIRWIKLHYRWSDPRPDRPDLDDPAWLDTYAFERWVDTFHRHGVRVMAQLSQVARWASSEPERDGTNHFGRGPVYALVAPRQVEDWTLMVRTVMERLHDRVDAWEIGNEPEGTIYWMGSVEQFSELVIAASQALHDIDPDAPLVVNMVNTWDKVWAREFLSHAGPILDVFGFHYASRDTVEWIRDELLAPRELSPAIWDTEAFGNTSALGVDRMFTSWLEQRAAGTSRLFHFVYHLPYYPTPETELAWIARFGQFPVNADYSPRVHAVGLRTLSDRVGDKDYAFDYCFARTLRAYVFDDGGNGVMVLSREDISAWDPAKETIARLRLPGRTTEIVVTDLMGNSRTIVRGKGRQVDVPLTGALTFVEGIPLRRITRLGFRGYVGADGRFLRKRSQRNDDVCTAWQLGYLAAR
jgi:hypothetical protein